MGKTRDRSNPADWSIARKGNPRITKKQPNQQNQQPQNLAVPTFCNKKNFKGQNKNNNRYQGPKPFLRRQDRKRYHSVDSPNWGTPVLEKVRALSPVVDENGIFLSKEQQEVFYRKKVNDFELKIPAVSNLDTLSTKNILAIVAGLTEEEPSTSCEATYNVTLSDDSGVDILQSSSNTTRRISPKLPQIPLVDLEDGEIIDDDIICLTDIKRKKKKRTSRSRKKPKARASYVPKLLDLIEIGSDNGDDDSVICLDDESSEKEFANLSITTECVEETVATSKEIVKDQNGVPNQVITESQHISKTTTVKTSAVVQCSAIEQNMGVDRFVRHFRRSIHPLYPLPLQLHLDSLSYHVAIHKRVTLRGPEFVGIPPLIMDTSKIFRVLSYNVLCQATMERTRYLYQKNIDLHPEFNIFCWENRWELLSLELQVLTADIYCLQEVEKDKVEGFYEPLMVGHKKFKSFYIGRGAENADGCAIFWNPVIFDKIKEICVHLNHGVPNLDRPNVAQILCLRHKTTGLELIVVNTHILFNPKRGDVKLYQLAVIFANLKKIRTKNQPIIFCGDFNLEPDSLLYNFITEGEIDCTKSQCHPSTMSGQKRKKSNDCPLYCFSVPEKAGVSNNCAFTCDEENKIDQQKLCHPFNFESVYGNATFDGHKVVSTYHQDQGNPDFMFYSVKSKVSVDENTKDVVENNLFLYRRLSLPDGNILEKYSDPFPNAFTGSDHIPLYAEFYFP